MGTRKCQTWVLVCLEVQDFQPARSFVDEGGRPADTRTKACKKENGLKGRFMSDVFLTLGN